MLTLTPRCRAVSSCKRVLFFILLTLLISNCEKEKEQARSYPRLREMTVTDISEGGAKFTASVYSLGTETIIEHGFVWGNYTDPDINNFDKVYLGPFDKTGEFTSEIVTNLIKDRKYYVKPFLVTADHVIYGARTSFISLGSGAPSISGFEPHTAGWMDTLTIRGNNFSYRNGVNVVKLNDVRCEVIESSDTLLRAVVNYLLSSPKTVLSVDNIGNICTFTQDTFRLIPPVVTDFYPRKAVWGDTLYIKGKYLKYPLYVPGNSVTLGSFKCSFLGSLNDSIYIVKVPYELDVVNSDLIISVNGFSLTGNSPFELQSPMPFTFSPVMGTWGSTINLSGRFNTILSANSVYFDDVQGTILSVSPYQMSIKVPDNLEKVSTNIIYKADPFTIVSSDTFRLEPPVITSFSPQSGAGESVLDIYGQYFGSGAVTVKLDTSSCSVISKTDSHISVRVPAGIEGAFKITVTVKLQSVTSETEFNVTNPVITSVSPLTGTFYDQVTISGRNLVTDAGTAVVLFGNKQAQIVSSSSTSVIVAVPSTADSISCEISLTAGASKVTWPDKFSLIPPVITSVSPGTLVPGQDVTITGQNFNPDLSGNSVLWDVYPLIVKSCSSTEIIATMPLSLPRGNYRLKVVVGGYQRYSTDYYDIKSKWLRIDYNQPFYWSNSPISYDPLVSFAQNGIGYIMNHSGYLYSFNPASGIFSGKGLVSEFRYHLGTTTITNLDTVHIIGGYYQTGPVDFRFDNSSEHFLFAAFSPESRSGGAGFSLNGKIFYGLAYYSALGTRFWVYDKYKGWIRKNDFPVNTNFVVMSYYSINNKGYVLLGDHSFYSYDPDADIWTNLAECPAVLPIQGYISFSINGKAYIGLGKNPDYSDTDELWSYDTSSDTWELAARIPGGGRYSPVVFTIGNKVYMGLGFHDYLTPGNLNTNTLKDLYEFDPSYLAK